MNSIKRVRSDQSFFTEGLSLRENCKEFTSSMPWFELESWIVYGLEDPQGEGVLLEEFLRWAPLKHRLIPGQIRPTWDDSKSTIGSAWPQMSHRLKDLVGTLEISYSNRFPKQFCLFLLLLFLKQNLFFPVKHYSGYWHRWRWNSSGWSQVARYRCPMW